MSVCMEAVGGRDELRRRVFELTESGLTIGQVMAELPRLGFDPPARSEVRSLMDERRHRIAARAHVERRRRDPKPSNQGEIKAVVRDDGMEYPSARAAAKAVGRSVKSVYAACRTGGKCAGHGFNYKEV